MQVLRQTERPVCNVQWVLTRQVKVMNPVHCVPIMQVPLWVLPHWMPVSVLLDIMGRLQPVRHV